MRDAEEKEQLTYVYLALAKEKGIDPTEWILRPKVYHLFHSIVYQRFTPKFTTLRDFMEVYFTPTFTTWV